MDSSVCWKFFSWDCSVIWEQIFIKRSVKLVFFLLGTTKFRSQSRSFTNYSEEDRVCGRDPKFFVTRELLVSRELLLPESRFLAEVF